MIAKRILLIFFGVVGLLSVKGQKVGVVLSGGGGSALAHVGVLKALEEHHIPIDYITGSSMGAYIGALYASGMSPSQIEAYITSQEFEQVAYSELSDEFSFFFRQRVLDPSFFGIKLAPKEPLRKSLPTHIYDSRFFDFELMTALAPADMAAGNNYDSLFVPFRCVAADVYNKELHVFDSGPLNQSVRASMTYPFYFYPIEIDSVLYFDGGLYNNFPKRIMEDDFNPDFIIGSNVSSNPQKPEADDLFSQLENLLSERSEYEIEPEKGVVIAMNIGIGTFDFSKASDAIEYGYQMTLSKIDQIESHVSRRELSDKLGKRRNEFNQKKMPLNFSTDVKTTGISSNQAKFIRSAFQRNKKKTNLEYTQLKYFRTYSDEKVNFIFPTATWLPDQEKYRLNLDITKSKDFEISLGGILSTAPINTGFVAARYNLMGKTSWVFRANLFFGKFYQSARISAMLDVPFKVPFYWEPFVAWNKYDYFRNRTSVIDKVQPPFIVTEEFYIGNSIGLPFVLKSLFSVDYKYFDEEYEYYTDRTFELNDTADVTQFKGHTLGITIEKFNQDYKQYPTEGTRFIIDGRFVTGEEHSEYYTTDVEKVNLTNKHTWYAVNLKLSSYPVATKFYSLGLNFEVNLSSMPYFSNYFGTLISFNAYHPIPEAITLFQPNFRANTWFGAGLSNVFKPLKKIHLRLEGFLFQPSTQIFPGDNGIIYESTLFEFNYYILAASIVYHTKIGPLSLNFNYYEDQYPDKSFSVNFGYTLFNRSARRR